VVDIQKIAEDLKEFKDLKASLEEEKQSIENQARQGIMKLREEDEDLETKTGILSEAAVREKMKKLQERYMKIQEDIGIKMSNIQNRLAVALTNLNDAIRAAVAEVVREKPGYLIVIEKQALLYYNSTDEITMEVLGKLNKKKLNLSKKPPAKEK
jgi:Skp family chaperone for outer membrane proteins